MRRYASRRVGTLAAFRGTPVREVTPADPAGRIPELRASARRADRLRTSREGSSMPDLGYVALTVLLFAALLLAIKGAERL